MTQCQSPTGTMECGEACGDDLCAVGRRNAQQIQVKEENVGRDSCSCFSAHTRCSRLKNPPQHTCPLARCWPRQSDCHTGKSKKTGAEEGEVGGSGGSGGGRPYSGIGAKRFGLSHSLRMIHRRRVADTMIRSEPDGLLPLQLVDKRSFDLGFEAHSPLLCQDASLLGILDKGWQHDASSCVEQRLASAGSRRTCVVAFSVQPSVGTPTHSGCAGFCPVSF